MKQRPTLPGSFTKETCSLPTAIPTRKRCDSFGPQFGHDAAYGYGNIAGQIGGAVGSAAISLGAGGMVACGKFWTNAAVVAWEGADIVGGIATAYQGLQDGEVGFADALNIVGVGFSVAANGLMRLPPGPPGLTLL